MLRMKRDKLYTVGKNVRASYGLDGSDGLYGKDLKLFAEGGEKGSTVKKVQRKVYDALSVPIHSVFGNPNAGSYGGGSFGGSGFSGKWPSQEYFYNEIYPADTLFVPVTETFNEAFANARKKGLKTFEFNGGTYGTELGGDANWKKAGDSRTRETVVPLEIPADTIRKRSSQPKEDVIHERRFGLNGSNGFYGTNGFNGGAGRIFEDGGDTRGGWFNLTKEQNPFSKMNVGSTVGALGPVVGQIGGGLISGGLQSGAGSVVSGVGSAVGSAVSTVNPLLGGIISAGSGLIGGLTNRAFGSKMNEGNINAIDTGNSMLRNAGTGLAGIENNDTLLSAWGDVDMGSSFSKSDVGKDGWFSNKASKKYKELKAQQAAARAFANHGLTLGVQGADASLDDAVLGNFAAFGGGLGMAMASPYTQQEELGEMPAVEYGAMMDWLDSRRKKTAGDDKAGKTVLPTFNYGLGGVVQTHGGDFSTGLVRIDAGGSHEANPHGGVQMGVDGQGVPNLVEEGERIFNDYVYSKRILADGGTLEKFHLSKKRKISFADLAELLEKESAERPNDPISLSGLKAQMAQLAEEQERQKREMEARRAEEAFEALSDEEKIALATQYTQQREATPEGMIPGGEAPGAMGAEEDISLMQQSEQPVMACGGKVNRYDGGGAMYKGKKLPVQGAFQPDSSYAKELEKAGFNNYEIDDIILGSGRSSMTYKPRTKAFKNRSAYRMVNGKPAPLYTEAEVRDELKQIFSGKGNDNSASTREQRAYGAARNVGRAAIDRLAAGIISGNTAPARATAPVQAAVPQINTPVWGATYAWDNVAPTVPAAAPKVPDEVVVPEETVVEPAVVEAAPERVVTPEEAPFAATPAAPVARAAQRRAGAAPATNVRNVGTWKDENENHWDVFTRPGLEKYLENLEARIAKAPDDATKDLIRRSAMNELNSLQQSYYSHVLPGAGATRYDYSDDIRNHQQLFDDLYGNTGFYRIDDNGNVKNLIADAINLPQGAATSDKPDNWVDGYNGRRTSIRNFGSTEYGDEKYYQGLVDRFKSLGLTYAPNDNWKYGENGANRLYGLSLPEADAAAQEPQVWDSAQGAFVTRSGGEPEYNVGNLWGAPWAKGANGTSGGADKSDGSDGSSGLNGDNRGSDGDSDGDWEVTPNYRAEWPMYAGLFGPAVGLGMQALGIGKPDSRSFDAVLEGYDNAGVRLADYQPIGNYLTYRPMDIWAEQNRLNANSRATDRAIANSGGTQGSRMAGLLASGYNDQVASGELYRKGLEYNDALRERVATFNRDTDKFNADAYNRTSLQNSEALNRARQFRAQLGMQAAGQKADADAGWYNGIYGNVSGLFKGISDLGRQNAQHNMIAEMAANGIFGPMSPSTAVGRKGKYLNFKKKQR